MATNKFLKLNPTTGLYEQEQAVTTQTANAIPSTDSSGRLGLEQMPVGVGPAMTNMQISGNVSAGDFVNVYNVAGVGKARRADASDATKPCSGFVLVGGADNDFLDVYFTGDNTACSGLTPGSRYFLSAATPGAAVSTPPSGSGNVVQPLGTAYSATSVAFQPANGTVLA